MSLRRWLGALADGAPREVRSHASASDSSETYEAEFVEFLKHTNAVGETAARELIAHSQQQFAGGWAGTEYRDFTERALEVLRPLYDDTPAALHQTYRVHAPFDFLRMLSYRIPPASELQAIVDVLAPRSRVVLVDYGCGLAQRTVALARALQSGGGAAHLVLVDIRRTPHVEFLSFVCDRHGIPADFIEVTDSQPFPVLPPHDYCDAVNVLEHIPEPVRVIDNIDASLRPGGLLVASIADQEAEMMHVSPDLSAARTRLEALGYRRQRQWLDATVFEKLDG